MLGPLYYKDRPTYVKEMTLYFSKLTKFEIRHIGLLFSITSVTADAHTRFLSSVQVLFTFFR